MPQGSRKTKQTGEGSHPRLHGDLPLIFNHPLPIAVTAGLWATQARTHVHAMQGCCIFWDKGLAVAGGCQGEEGSTNSSPLISNHHVTDRTEKQEKGPLHALCA